MGPPSLQSPHGSAEIGDEVVIRADERLPPSDDDIIEPRKGVHRQHLFSSRTKPAPRPVAFHGVSHLPTHREADPRHQIHGCIDRLTPTDLQHQPGSRKPMPRGDAQELRTTQQPRNRHPVAERGD